MCSETKNIQGYDDLVTLMLKKDDSSTLREENRNALGISIAKGTSF